MNLPFESAVARYGPTVLRVCRAVLGPSADADDAWSETFLAALKAWPDLDESTNIEAWLVRVAHRKAIDITRQHARRAKMGSGEHRQATAMPPLRAGTCGSWWPPYPTDNVKLLVTIILVA